MQSSMKWPRKEASSKVSRFHSLHSSASSEDASGCRPAGHCTARRRELISCADEDMCLN